jgi:hypothetical protein
MRERPPGTSRGVARPIGAVAPVEPGVGAVEAPSTDAVEGLLRVRFVDERRATALAHELADIATLHAHPEDDAWDVDVGGSKTNPRVLRVLDAVRQALAGERGAFALVTLDGREYRLYGE